MAKNLFIIFVLMMSSSVYSSDINWDKNISGLISFQIPPVLFSYFKNKNKKDGDVYSIVDAFNPMYLRIDINGDGKYEYAVMVKNESTDKMGILICFSETDGIVLFSDTPIIDLSSNEEESNLDEYNIDFWYVSDNKNIEQNAEEKISLKAKGEVLVVGRSESFSSSIFWDGNKYYIY